MSREHRARFVPAKVGIVRNLVAAVWHSGRRWGGRGHGRRRRPRSARRTARRARGTDIRRSASPPSPASSFVMTGYVDVGFAKAQGNGTSFPAGYVAPIAVRRWTTSSTPSPPR